MNTMLAWLCALIIAIGGAWLLGSEHGSAAVRLEDAKALAVATAKAEAKTAALNLQLQDAIDEKAKSDAALAAYAAANPLEPVRLCLAPRSTVPGSQAVASHADSTASAPGDVQQVPSGDSGIRAGAGPDISGLLSVLADKADQLSDQTRGLQQAVQGR
jgi:hypothetical protein